MGQLDPCMLGLVSWVALMECCWEGLRLCFAWWVVCVREGRERERRGAGCVEITSGLIGAVLCCAVLPPPLPRPHIRRAEAGSYTPSLRLLPSTGSPGHHYAELVQYRGLLTDLGGLQPGIRPIGMSVHCMAWHERQASSVQPTRNKAPRPPRPAWEQVMRLSVGLHLQTETHVPAVPD